MSEELDTGAISARGELHRVTRTLKRYLKWQQANGAIGSVPAPGAERAAFEATQKAREQAKLDNLKAGLRGPQSSAPPTPEPPTSSHQSAAPEMPTATNSSPTNASPTSRFAKKAPSTQQAAPDIQGTSKSAPWKTHGSRPTPRFKGRSAESKPTAETTSDATPNTGAKRTPTKPSAQQDKSSSPSQKSAQRPAAPASTPKPTPQKSKPTPPRETMSDEDDIDLMDGDEIEMEMPSDYNPAMFYEAASAPAKAPSPAAKDPATMSKAEKLEFLRNYMGDCQRCGLCEGRSHVVFGAGNPDARLVFIADAPGASDDQAGAPFAQSSRAGTPDELLAKMVGAMGLSLDDVYLCTVVKCRPPGDRRARADEVKECQPFLFKQLGVIEPEVIVALGGVATLAMSVEDPSIKPARGQWQTWRGIPLMPTHHPRDLIAREGQKQAEQKRATWQDLQVVMAKLGLK